MDLISLSILLFIVFETLNVLTLYFAPESKLGNGTGVFNALHTSRESPETHSLVRYLINWVAGTKLIFIGLLAVILLKADTGIKQLTALVLIVTILTFYWRLFPSIRKMDREDQISPKGYSRTLGWMILGMVLLLTTALLISYFG